MGQPSLEGVRAKLARSEEHLKALATKIDAFGESDPYELVLDYDSDTGKLVARVKVLREPDSLNWGIRLGDGIQNLRAALDHLVWQLVLLNKQTPGKRNAFPLASRGTQYWCSGKDGSPSMRDRTLRGVADEHRAIIDTVQPYRRGDPLLDPLAHLSWLSNVDKHQVVHAAAAANEALTANDVSISTPSGGETVSYEFYAGALENGAKVFEATITPPSPEKGMEVETNITFGVAFGDRDGRAFRAKRLPELFLHVKRIVGTFEPFFEKPPQGADP